MVLMPAWIGAQEAFGVKAVTFFPGNSEGLPPLLGVVLLLDWATGRPCALLDAVALTAIRTASASAVATKALARANARELALIGAGTQARAHLAAMVSIRPIERVRVAATTLASATRFAVEERDAYPGLTIEPVDSARAAVQGADVVCTVTTATAPVVQSEWLSAGCHINAVGAHSPGAREIDGKTMQAARVVVDSREANLSECGDCLIAISEGLFSPDHVSDEIGEVLLGTKTGRTDDDQVTVYQSCGLAVQDVAAAKLVYEKALSLGMGARVELF
jgi:ornithine cyclodeaminase